MNVAPSDSSRHGLTAQAHLATWLRSVRLGQGRSQEWVAHEADIAVSTYARMERMPSGARGSCNPSLSTLAKVFRALRISSAEFVAASHALATSTPVAPHPRE